MGAWGIGNYENDDALDWAYDLEQTQDTTLIIESLETITEHGDEYLEDPDCCIALAATEVVAALKNVASPNLPNKVKQWVSLRQNTGEDNLVQLALKAIQRIRTNSELKDLWDESKYKAEWYNALDDVERRLNQVAI